MNNEQEPSQYGTRPGDESEAEPVVVTKAMKVAAWDEAGLSTEDGVHVAEALAEKIYRAMVAAAPSTYSAPNADKLTLAITSRKTQSVAYQANPKSQEWSEGWHDGNQRRPNDRGKYVDYSKQWTDYHDGWLTGNNEPADAEPERGSLTGTRSFRETVAHRAAIDPEFRAALDEQRPLSADDTQPQTDVDRVLDQLDRRVVGAPERLKLRGALDKADAPDKSRTGQDAAVGRALRVGL